MLNHIQLLLFGIIGNEIKLNNMSLTIPKKVRHSIYKKALKLYIESIKVNKNYGLCLAIEEALYALKSTKMLRDYVEFDYFDAPHIPSSIHPYNNLQKYLEIYACKPENQYSRTLWFPSYVTTRRIEIFEKAIEETKPIKKK